MVGHVKTLRMGWLEEWLKAHHGGYRFYYAASDRLPDPDSIRGPVIVLGGPMGIRDIPQLPWLASERDWVGRILEAGLPYLGICLGAQLMASAVGYHVGPCPRGTGAMECGYYRTHSARLPEWVYHWHRDGIFWEEGGPLKNLAFSPWLRGKTSQAIMKGRALGIQFHPEISPEVIRDWLDRDAAHLDLPGARPAHTHLSDYTLHAGENRFWLEKRLARMWGRPFQTDESVDAWGGGSPDPVLA